MANSNEKYTEYREIIDKALEGAKGADDRPFGHSVGRPDQDRGIGQRVAENGGEQPKAEDGDKAASRFFAWL